MTWEAIGWIAAGGLAVVIGALASLMAAMRDFEQKMRGGRD